MNILIIGCGRVGANLALTLCEAGNDVSIVDKNARAFELLDERFSGLTFEGVPIDEEVLIKAGVRSCDVVYTVTDDDNLNIMASQLCSEIFKVERVYTRVADPKKEQIYNEMGLHTICPTNYTVDAFMSLLTEYKDAQHIQFDNHTVKFFAIPLPPEMAGKTALNIDLEPDEILYAVVHADGVMKLVTNYNIVLNEGDKLIFSKLVD